MYPLEFKTLNYVQPNNFGYAERSSSYSDYGYMSIRTLPGLRNFK
jgi:hypothetical protein